MESVQTAAEQPEQKANRRHGPRSGPGRPSPEQREKILEKLRQATERREAARQEMSDAEDNFREEIRRSFGQGVTVGPIMATTGLSETRAYQIRDNKRQ